MSPARFTFACRELSLKSPLVTSQTTVTRRRIILIAVQTADGRIAVAESAPLPEFGTESFDTALDTIRDLSNRDALPALPESVNDTTAWLGESCISSRHTPTMAFAVDCALTGLIAAQRDVPLPTLLSAFAPPDVRVSALLGGETVEQVMASARGAVAQGFDTVKFKVGARPIVEDVELVKRLREEHPALALRADANGAWTLVEACAFGHDVEQCDLEYVEDPLHALNVEDLVALQETCPVPVALDRFARRVEDVERILDRDLCDVLVLKPSAIGNLGTLSEFSAMARKQDVKVVVSSLIESSLGLGWLAACASAYGSPELAHGLGTAPLLASDTVSRPLLPAQGRVTLRDLRMSPSDLSDDLRSELQIVREK